MLSTLEEWPRGRVCVQLYGYDPDSALVEYLQNKGASIDSVAPYRYADNSSTKDVLDFIDTIVERRVDAVVFTSKAQVNRLFSIADKADKHFALKDKMSLTTVASVGPVFVDEL